MPGRNDPCPCGSGRKYKKCHGKPISSTAGLLDQPAPADMHQGMIVRDLLRDEAYTIGGPGVEVALPVFTRGNLTPILSNPDDYVAVLHVDLPFYLPIEHGPYDVRLSDRYVQMYHIPRKRGEEEFSTLDTAELPYFSQLEIQMQPFADYMVPSPQPVKGEPSQRWKSYTIIIEVLEKLDGFLRMNSQIELLSGLPPKLSYRIGYFSRGEPIALAAESVYVISGTVRIHGPESGLTVDNLALHAYLSQAVKLEEFARREIAPTFANRTFKEQALITLHDFCYYCRQHARAIALLGEEQIRDLFLVLVKTLFGGGEGEAFHYDGKLDYKVVNPINKYEFITGEMKWWSGPASAKEVYHQGVRKHATGQEAEIHLIMLNSNRDVRAMAAEFWDSIETELDTKSESRFVPCLPAGSKERFAGFVVEIRGENVPLIAAVADLYHEKT